MKKELFFLFFTATFVIFSISFSNAQNGASLKIDCNQSGATVKLNGIVKGTTPLEIIVLPGSFKLTVTKPLDENFEYSYIETINVKNLETKHISIKLGTQVTETYKKKIDATLTNIQFGSTKDSRDGKTYKTIKIGTQTWMAENLAYKTSGGCIAYDNNNKNVDAFGYMYNWETAMKACPSGWHLSSVDEWRVMENYLGQKNETIKWVSKTGWTGFKGIANNSSGFTALPGGTYDKDDGFWGIGTQCAWWTTDSWARDPKTATDREISNINNGLAGAGFNKSEYRYVRCIKD